MDKEVVAKRILQTLRAAGHVAYLAGGCVRDRLRGVEPKDFDIATSATPDVVQSLFPKTVPIGAQFGVILIVEEEAHFEVATFRTEGGYQDGRHPTKVSFTNVEEDARRRDFTVNGLFSDPDTNQILDFVGGKSDLQKKIIRTIGDAKERFLEDHLRMLRAVRFAVQLEFELDPETFRTIGELAHLITKVSAERIRDELSKILTSPQPARGIRLMDQCGLLKLILPEVDRMKGVEQPMEYHPEGDVFIHTMMLLDGCANAPLELAMGCLLHDVAKPDTFVRAPDRIRFHGHDTIGAEKSEHILRRLAYSGQQIEIICSLVREHLRFKDAFNMRVSTLKRFLSLERFDLHLALHRLDCMASHGHLEAYEFCKAKWEEFKKLPPPPRRLVTGEDLLNLGFSPGPQFRTILQSVEDEILEGRIATREEAMAYVRQTFVPPETKG